MDRIFFFLHLIVFFVSMTIGITIYHRRLSHTLARARIDAQKETTVDEDQRRLLTDKQQMCNVFIFIFSVFNWILVTFGI